MRWAGRLAGRNSSGISKENLTVFMAREETNSRTPLRCHFSVFLGGKKNVLLIQSENYKTCLYNLPILVILESRYFFCKCRWRSRKETLKLNRWDSGNKNKLKQYCSELLTFTLKYIWWCFSAFHIQPISISSDKMKNQFQLCKYFKCLPKMIWTHRPKSPDDVLNCLLYFLWIKTLFYITL